MRIEILRQSGQPIHKKDQQAYAAEWATLFDKIQERAKKAVDKRALRKLSAMVVSTRMCDVLEKRLFIKYAKKVKVAMPVTELAWAKLIKKYGAPVLCAQRQDNSRLVLIIMDTLGQ